MPYVRPRALQDARLADLDLAALKQLRNTVIGSRTHKAECVKRGRIVEIIALLRSKHTDTERKIILTVILGSLAQNTQASTVLALCRGGAVGALFAMLAEHAHPLAVALAAADSVASTDEHLGAVEACMRSLKQIIGALAFAAGSPDERLLQETANTSASSLAGPSGSGTSSPTQGNSRTSTREDVGWHLADAGFSVEGGALSFPEPMPVSLRGSDTSNPEGELILRARQTIDDAFRPENLRLWVGALFVAKIQRHSSKQGAISGRVTASNSRVASAASSRASTRPASPAIGTTPLHSSAANSRASSRMSLASQTSQSRVGVASTAYGRIHKIYEMVLETLSDAIDITYLGAGQDASETPIKALERRKKAVLRATADQSPYFVPKADENPERTAGSTHAGVASGLPAHMTDTHRDAMELDERPPEMQADMRVLDVLIDAINSGRTNTQLRALLAVSDVSKDSHNTSYLVDGAKDRGQPGRDMNDALHELKLNASYAIRVAALACFVSIESPPGDVYAWSTLYGLMDLMTVTGSIQIRALVLFKRLLTHHVKVQTEAALHGCVELITSLLASTKNITQRADQPSLVDYGQFGSASSEHYHECLREACLGALTALCLETDDIRRRFVDQSMTPAPLTIVVQSLTASRPGLRIAACTLIRALSRSVSVLRTSLMDAGATPKLLAILQDKNELKEVKCEVLAVFCNLVLKFSPVRQMLVEGNGIDTIVALTHSDDGQMRLNAWWAVRNTLYYAPAPQKRRIMASLGWAHLKRETLSPDLHLRHEALGALRNIVQESDGNEVQTVLDSFGGSTEFFATLGKSIWPAQSPPCIEQVANILVNMASTSDAHRTLISSSSDVLDAIVFFLRFPVASVRLAGLWAIHNLVHNRDGREALAAEIMKRLQRFDFLTRIHELLDDTNRDVSDRAKILLQRLSVAA